MAEEEEDKLLLSRLGVTSANAEEVEHDVLKKMENDAICTKEDLEDRPHDEEHGMEPSSATYAEIFTKLRAVTAEIGVVTASINHIKNVDGCENNDSADIDVSKGNIEHLNDSDSVRMTTDGLTIQQALASERLRDLQITKAWLQNEITRFEKDMPVDNIGDGNILEKLVKDESKKKHKSKGQSLKNSKRKAVAYDDDVEFDTMLDAATSGLVETERDKLVRKGILTPFHSLKGLERRVQQPKSSSRSHPQDDEGNENLASASIAKLARSISEIAQSRSATKLVDAKSLPKLEGPTHQFERLRSPLKRPISPDELWDEGRKTRKLRRPLPDKKWRKKVEIEDILQNEVDEDEGRESVVLDDEPEKNDHEEDSDSGRQSCVVLEGGLRIPETVYSKLFDYQKVGVQWLWELHCQRAGGIIGDEMGLGKTVQVLSFLGALHFSKKYKPSIVICPATLLRQWQREAKKWYPKFHVEILHDSAHVSAKSEKPKASNSDNESEEGSLDSENGRDRHKKSRKRWNDLIHSVLNSKSGLLLTTYEQLRIFREKLLDIEWGYAILDEGHRIRNPNAEVTLLCKQLQTVHRIIMTGAPIQNKLAELWSLFDFIFPGKLGVLPVFEMEFAVPISIGGYANATPLQVSTAYRCAVVLRDLIMPYLLRRMKADVNVQLTTKTEHVLFCSLTTDQRSLYRAFLASSEVEQIFDGSRNSLYGIDIMRKICNHPDVLEREHAAKHPDYGNPDRSGKMKVVAQVLELWKEQGHRVLLFTQTQQMLDIFEIFLNTSGYTYRRMDGLTPIKHRMALIDEFNNSTEVFVFILTTKVGGLGTNLTGANRVIIYDPDWNPSTDMQARERAWRIGQTRDVTVYRLITRGTIEEKVYHRQIYKHFLTNKILKNPQQKRFFKARDMRDLFTLQDDGGNNSTETSNIFGQLPGDVSIVLNGDNKGTQMPLPVPPVSKCDIAETGSSDPGEDASKVKGNTEAGEGDEETNILKSLFSAQGIHSVVNHDVIMSANDDDRVKMEEQASLVAQRAAEALRQSRLLRSHDIFSVPTWTGKSGAAGAPSYVSKKFGSTVNTKLLGTSKSSSDKPIGFQVGASTGKALSSAELLARTRGNREKAAGDGLEHQLGSSSNSRKLTPASGQQKSSRNIVQPEVLIRQLCTFIQQRGGRADSGSIVQHFKDRIPTKDLPLFRGLLKEIAVLEKDAGSRGSHWVLKPEYVE